MKIINKITHKGDFSYWEIFQKIIINRPKTIGTAKIPKGMRSKRKPLYVIEFEYHPHEAERKDGRDYRDEFLETIWITFLKMWTLQIRY